MVSACQWGLALGGTGQGLKVLQIMYKSACLERAALPTKGAHIPCSFKQPADIYSHPLTAGHAKIYPHLLGIALH